MQIDNEFIYEMTKEYVPGWTFRYTHRYDKREGRREEVTVVETYPLFVVVTNGIYTYCVQRFELWQLKQGIREVINVEED